MNEKCYAFFFFLSFCLFVFSRAAPTAYGDSQARGLIRAVATGLRQSHSIFFLFLLFGATPTAYGGSQARGLIRAFAASLRHSHSNTRSKPSLRPTPQLMATPVP